MANSPFQDHFSTLAPSYAQHRPEYPDALYAWLAGICEDPGRALDCATGNGQAARGLTRHFRQVVAMDGSESQVAHRGAGSKAQFLVGLCEELPLLSDSMDLITVAQALHWFPNEAFFAEARRIGKPGSILAAWGYSLFRCQPDLDQVVTEFHDEVVGPHWPERRHYLRDGYARLPFPLQRLETPAFQMEVHWTCSDLLGYLATWSAVNRFRHAKTKDPLPWVAERLPSLWSAPDTKKRFTWDLHLLVGRLES